MDDVNRAISDQRELLDSLKKRISGSVPEIDYDKLQYGTFMSRYYLTNCLEQGWLNPYDSFVSNLIVGWSTEYPEFMSKCIRNRWLDISEPGTKDLVLKHAIEAPHRYVLHFLLEGWLDPKDKKVLDLILLTLNEGNSSIYIDKGWLTQSQVDSVLGEDYFNF